MLRLRVGYKKVDHGFGPREIFTNPCFDLCRGFDFVSIKSAFLIGRIGFAVLGMISLLNLG